MGSRGGMDTSSSTSTKFRIVLSASKVTAGVNIFSYATAGDVWVALAVGVSCILNFKCQSMIGLQSIETYILDKCNNFGNVKLNMVYYLKCDLLSCINLSI